MGKDPKTEAEKEAQRRAKRQAQLQKHAVDCPHCGKSVLDHMTECPYCKGALTPRGYTPISDRTQKIIKGVLWGVSIALIVTGIALLMIYKK